MSGEGKDHKAACPLCGKIFYAAWSKSVCCKLERHIKRHGKKKVAELVRATWDIDQYLFENFAFNLARKGEDKNHAMTIIGKEADRKGKVGIGAAIRAIKDVR